MGRDQGLRRHDLLFGICTITGATKTVARAHTHTHIYTHTQEWAWDRLVDDAIQITQAGYVPGLTIELNYDEEMKILTNHPPTDTRTHARTHAHTHGQRARERHRHTDTPAHTHTHTHTYIHTQEWTWDRLVDDAIQITQAGYGPGLTIEPNYDEEMKILTMMARAAGGVPFKQLTDLYVPSPPHSHSISSSWR